MPFRRQLLVAAFMTAGLPLIAQTSNAKPVKPTPVAATAPTVVPALVPYSAVATGDDGKPLAGEVNMTYLLFKDETGGEPLWTESQIVPVEAAGRYSVQLGAGSASGLPLTVFSSGQARWLEVQIAGQKPQPRALLTSVPYAAKAADAATLDGLPASAFVLAGVPTREAAGTNGANPDATSDVTTTGGTAFYLPKFTGASTIVASEIYDTGTSVGIGDKPNPIARLDVNGQMIMRGNMTVSRTANATASTGYPSYGFQFFSNAYNSSTKATDNPHFQLQSEPTGNNTSNTGATFNLLYSNHGATPVETGLSVNPSGVISFAPGQTFPGAGGGTITDVTAGSGLSGGGSSGAVTLKNTGILAFTAGSGLKSTGGQSPTLSVDTTIVPTLTDNPVFTGIITVSNDSPYGEAFVATNSANWDDNYNVFPIGSLGEATGQAGIGVEGFAPAGTGVTGLAGGYSGNGFDFASNPSIAGVWGDTTTPADGSTALGGVAGFADDNWAGFFSNYSTDYTTLEVFNAGTGGSGLFRTLQASSPDGTCGIGSGSLTCTGQMKSLTTTDGGTRKVETYAMQSPENWMEDFGSGNLQHGVAAVALDPLFVETANTGVDYHVFLTARGDCKGLYVTATIASGFEVHEFGGGTSTLAFDYRVVAKRRGYEAQRLTDVTDRFAAETGVVNRRIQMAHDARTKRLKTPTLPQVEGPKHAVVVTNGHRTGE